MSVNLTVRRRIFSQLCSPVPPVHTVCGDILERFILESFILAQSHRKKALFHAYFVRRCARIMSFTKYYACHRDDICIARRARCTLSQQKPRYILSQTKPCEKDI